MRLCCYRSIENNPKNWWVILSPACVAENLDYLGSRFVDSRIKGWFPAKNPFLSKTYFNGFFFKFKSPSRQIDLSACLNWSTQNHNCHTHSKSTEPTHPSTRKKIQAIKLIESSDSLPQTSKHTHTYANVCMKKNPF